ncbi:MAG: flagellar hook-length control protein FliK [Velocimicrobium sp.]
MMTQSVLTQGVNLFSGSKVSQNASKGSATSTVPFSTIMNQNTSAKKADYSQNNMSEKTETKQQASDKDFQTTVDTTTKSKATKVDTNGDKQATVKEDETAPEIMEEAISQMQTMIVCTVTETLGISREELNSFLDEFNLEPTDLLNPENAMKLLMQVNDTDDVMQLLTNDSLSVQLKELTSALDQLELPQEFAVTKEDIMTVLKTSPKEVQSDIQREQTSDVSEDTQPQILVERSVLTKESVESTSKENSQASEMEQGETLQSQKVESGVTNQNESQDQGNRDRKSQDQQAPIETFVENLAIKGQSQTMTPELLSERVEEIRNIVEQVVEQIKIQIKPETTSMELQLNPQNLGKINLSVASKDGQLTATITTQTELTKQALEGQIQILKDNLNNQGLKVEAVEVNVSNFQFNSSQNNQTGSGEEQKKGKSNRKRIDLNAFDEQADDVTEEEVLASKVMQQNGGNVDYTA